MEYLETLRKLEKQGAALEPDSEEERQAIKRFQGLLSDFKAPGFRPRVGLGRKLPLHAEVFAALRNDSRRQEATARS